MSHRLVILIAVLLLRLPFLNHPIQGDDAYYLAMAQHAQIEPLHPTHFRHVSTGIEVDMRGYPHPAMNAWVLALLLAIFGDVREIPFHLAYLPFSLAAAFAAYSIAQRLCSRPLWATLLFLASPAFVINGTSLESDLPHIAFFLSSIAFFLASRLLPAAACMALAVLTAYQAVVLVPILAAFLWQQRSRSWKHWAVLLTPLVTVAAYQAFERLSTGALPAAVLGGYFQSYGLQSLTNKLRNAVALTVHLGWIVSPLLAPLSWVLIPIAALAAFYDSSPLFFIPFALGLITLWHSRKTPWIWIFFLSALAIFFAGSARYLLPIALPVAILAVNRSFQLVVAGLVTHAALSLALASANYQHWQAYRRFVTDIRHQIQAHRTWITGEWGLRFYAEDAGAMPMRRAQPLRPGDLVLSSRLGFPAQFTTGGGTLTLLESREVRPSLPLRILDLSSCSAYSSAQRGLCAFGVSSAPADEVRLSTITEREPQLSFLPMNAPEAESQLLSGVYSLENNSWRWAGPRATVLLKPPAQPTPLTATFRLLDQTPARRITLSVNGVPAAEQTYTGPGLYTIRADKPVLPPSGPVTVTLSADRSFQPPGDNRELALILTAIGFTN
ncbi:MAG: glycosyltransferase family 39 protein [Bryobacterales bacterium]|nr:glycosyltransferase family 39 protein [Bryobacterales bacterium]